MEFFNEVKVHIEGLIVLIKGRYKDLTLNIIEISETYRL